MSKGPRIKHQVDILFLMVLFLIFTFSAVSVLLLAINSYRNIVIASDSNSSTRTAIAYVKEVIHQNDVDGQVYFTSFEGLDAIEIRQDDEYSIFIYTFDGKLMELNTKKGSGAGPEDGTSILEVSKVEMEEIEGTSIIELVIDDRFGNQEIVDVSVKSTKRGESYGR